MLAPSLNSKALAGSPVPDPDEYDQHQTGDLDASEDQVEPDRLGDAVEVDEPYHHHEHERGENARHSYELREVIAGEGQAQNARRSEAGRRHSEGHHKAYERVSEGVVDVGGGPASPRIFGDQLGVGGRGEDREDKSTQKRDPDRAADNGPDLADQRVDPGPHDVAEDEEKQQPRTDAAF